MQKTQHTTSKTVLNYVITKTELAIHLHAAFISSYIKALQQAISNKSSLAWPIEDLNVNEFSKTATATEQGYLDQEPKI